MTMVRPFMITERKRLYCLPFPSTGVLPRNFWGSCCSIFNLLCNVDHSLSCCPFFLVIALFIFYGFLLPLSYLQTFIRT